MKNSFVKTKDLYQNIQEEKIKVLERLSKITNDGKKKIYNLKQSQSIEESYHMTERDKFINELILCKPWLKNIGFGGWKLENLKSKF